MISSTEIGDRPKLGDRPKADDRSGLTAATEVLNEVADILKVKSTLGTVGDRYFIAVDTNGNAEGVDALMQYVEGLRQIDDPNVKVEWGFSKDQKTLYLAVDTLDSGTLN